MQDESSQHRVAWIPWVLALVALLGVNTLMRDDCGTRRNETFDGVGLSAAAKDPGSVGRSSDLLVVGPPAPKESVCDDPESKFLKLETGSSFEPASSHHEAARGRAPPLDA